MPLLRNLVSTVAKNTSRDLWSDISGVLWSGLLDMAVRISVSSSWYLSLALGKFSWCVIQHVTWCPSWSHGL